jgi:hypothetical protein
LYTSLRTLVKDETATKEALLTFYIIDEFVNNSMYLKDIYCFENSPKGLEILLLLLSRNEIPDERPWASFKHSWLTARETATNQRKMKKAKKAKKKNNKNKKRRSKMKVKGREITLLSPYEQYAKTKTEFVKTNGKCHKNTV